MRISHQKHNQLKVIVIILGSLTAITAQAEMRIMSKEEYNKNIEDCLSEPDCKKDYDRIAKIQAKKMADLEVLCTSDQIQCLEIIAQEEAKLAKDMAECRKNFNACYEEINKTATKFEQQLIESMWCEARPRVCDYVKSRRVKREKEGRTWCDDHIDACQSAKQHETDRIKWHEDRRKKQEQKQKIKQREIVRKKLLHISEQKDKQLIKCNGDFASCKTNINARMQKAAQGRAQLICEKSKTSDLCKVAKEISTSLKTKGKQWCDSSPSRCKDAHDKFVAQ